MDSSQVLDLTSLVAGVAFVGLFVSGIVSAGTVNGATIRGLQRAIRLYWFAIPAASVALIANLLDVSNDGPLWPLLSVVTLFCAIANIVFTRRRLELKGDQVMAEAERTVRDFRSTREL